MEIKIHAHHFNLTDSQKETVTKKVEKLTQFAARLSDESSEIRVNLGYEKVRRSAEAYKCEITLFVPRDTMRAEARNESLENAVDEVIEKIKGQIEYYKSKISHLDERK